MQIWPSTWSRLRRGRPHTLAQTLAVLALASGPACQGSPKAESAQQSPASAKPATVPNKEEARPAPSEDPTEEELRRMVAEVESMAERTHQVAATEAEIRHKVVYADRSSHSYLLLLPAGAVAKGFDRASMLKAITAAKLPGLADLDDETRQQLRTLVERESPVENTGPDAKPAPQEPADKAANATYPDLIGLYLGELDLAGDHREVLSGEVRSDPLLARTLGPKQRQQLLTSTRALVIRADYRVGLRARGLRLLQSLTTALAHQHHALVHDPDTLETHAPDTLHERRYRGMPNNIGDQVVVLPFLVGEGKERRVRLATRGMRRFGVVDLEFDGLPAQGPILERATHLILAAAGLLAHDASVDDSGFAVEVPEEIIVARPDIEGVFAREGLKMGDCGGCPGQTTIHLVEREARATDATGHVVARIVGPRSISDEADYDHEQWLRSALLQLFGNGLGR